MVGVVITREESDCLRTADDICKARLVYTDVTRTQTPPLFVINVNISDYNIVVDFI